MEKRRGFFRAAAGGSLLLLGLALAGCAGAGGSGFAARTAEEGYVAQTIMTMVEALNASDVPRFMSKVSTGYYRGFAQLEKRVQSSLAGRRDYKLDAEIEGMTLDDPKITATVAWKAGWVPRAGGAPQASAGKVRLVFMKGMGIKLIDQSEDTLFGF